MLESIKKFLEAIKEISTLIIQIFNILKAYWFLFVVLGLACAIYIGLVFSCIYHPSECIRRFFHYAEKRDEREKAWNLIYIPYRNARWANFKDFDSGFKTTIAYSNLSIIYRENPWSPAVLIRAILGEPLEYDVSFSVCDSFKATDFNGDAQQDDLLWLNIAHRRTFHLLKNGMISCPTNPTGALEMTRIYKKRIELRKSPTWMISVSVRRRTSYS